MSDIYTRAIAAIKLAWVWVTAAILASGAVLGVTFITSPTATAEDYWLLMGGTVLEGALWGLLSFALHLAILKPENERGIHRNLGLIWPYLWRAVALSVLVLIALIPVLLTGIVMAVGWTYADAGKMAVANFGLTIVALVISYAVTALLGTWLPAAIVGRSAALSDAYRRGRSNFATTFLLLLKGPLLLSAITSVFVYLAGSAWPEAIPRIMLVLLSSAIEWISVVFVIAMTTGIICAAYRAESE